VNLLRTSSAAVLEFAITNNFGSETNDIANFYSLRSLSIVFAPRASRSVQWVADNVERWKHDNEDWFKIERIPDEFLPAEVYAAEGGTGRRRRSQVDDVAGTEKKQSRVHPDP